MKQNINYGYDTQKLYLEIMLSDAETFARCQSIFDHTLFDKRLQLPAEFINEYVKTYSVLPTLDIINSVTHAELNAADPSMKEGHFDWFLDQFETFIRHKSLEQAILNSADLLERGEYGPVESMIKKAVQVGLTKDIGTDYFLDPKTRLLKIQNKTGQVSTGWTSLDYPLFGGVNRGELSIFTAGSGIGKSLVLANLGVNWALAGLHVIYLTFELSEELVASRIDSMITGIPTRDIFKNIDDVEIKIRLVGRRAGTLQIKYMPTGKSANDLRSYLKEYEVKTGHRVDALLVDYLDLMYPINKKVSASDLFVKDKYVSEELRDLAMEKNCVLITAAQLNRCLDLNTIVELADKSIPIQQLCIGDQIRSKNSFVTVKEILPIISQPVFKITTQSGNSITCSAKHKFPTTNGLTKLETTLKPGTSLFVNGKWEHVKYIDYVGVRPTIDINVSGDRLFYANGILVHNSAVEEVEYDHSHIAGGISKIQTADNVIGIYSSRSLRENGRYQFQLMKTRSSSGVGQKIELAFDVDTLRITDLAEGTEPSATMAELIKQRATTSDDPNSAAPVRKVKAEVESSALRAMLNKLSQTN